jgi:hypothetical protein
MPESPPQGTPDVAVLGLEAAAAVVERMLAIGRGAAAGIRLPFPPNGEPPAPAPAGPGAAEAPTAAPTPAQQARRFRADADRLVELYAEWTRLLVDGAATLAEQAAQEGAAAPGGDILVVGPVAAGTSSTASAWLHVLDGPTSLPAPLHTTTLVAHDGATVPRSAVAFDPPFLDTSAARTTHEIRVSVSVPSDTRPGRYHGHVLATGLEEVALAVRVEVVA